jgi:hypothetical protein
MGFGDNEVHPLTGYLYSDGTDVFIDDVDLKWTTDGGGDIGASAANRPASVYATTSIRTPAFISSSYFSLGGVVLLETGGDANTGLGGDISRLRQATDRTLANVNAARADGANNIVFADVYDRNAASITNAATMRLRSFGWTDNADSHTEVAAVYCDGLVEGTKGIRASGDRGNGTASTTTLTNATNAPDDTQAVLGNYHVNGSAGTFTGWIKVWVGTTAAYIPYWEHWQLPDYWQ